ncbi:maleylpyruvate isomerase family mycothiol-dependent enzyme [Cumulibacter soli]|uniref:maleylpyruvate isomerase family mycothiol-dependent enzyme n=1 Tax=Cumulibacter soli TaxID=2546344 RepID=UPI001067DA6D|nr:maleylpyruvate isomerase family mycothiol-dependent enzyme [Cumulibacter soli]
MTNRDQIVDAYQTQFAATAALMAGLTDEQWTAPSILPGWRVTDVLAHCLGTEYMLLGEQPPALDGEPPAHVHNEIARRNEEWVHLMREDTPQQMRDRWADVAKRRNGIMSAQTQEDFDAESWTPIGKGTLGDFMRIRVYDIWLHELDIRDSLGMPPAENNAPAEIAVAEVERALGYMIGKKAAAPDGSRVRFELTGPVQRAYGITVDGGRAKSGEPMDDPTVTVRMSSTDFARLTGNRGDIETVAQRVDVSGDTELGQRIARSLGYTM